MAEARMSAQELIDLLARFYAKAPRDKIISIGHWVGDGPDKMFSAQVRITVDDLRHWQSKP
jgi:hypothetical protein